VPKQSSAKGARSIQKDQLHSESGFIRFSNTGYNETSHRLNITPEFLAAARQDGFIIPLLEEPIEAIDKVGDQSSGVAHFYSPHQLSMVVALRNNVVKDGRLTSERQLAWGPESYRTILWGSNLGITVHADTGKPIGEEPYLNDLPRVARVLNSFLRLMHTYPQVRSYTPTSIHRQRLFNGAPSIDFDLTDLTKNVDKVMAAHNLSADDLKFLRSVVGGLAAQIDPLEYWHEYLALHPQDRKDKLKGDALIAQELYLTCDLIVDVITAVSEAEPPPLITALHENDPIKPFLMQRQRYAAGRDTYALKGCIQQVRDWMTSKAPKGLIPDQLLEQLTTAETHVDDFIKKYGHLSYLTGVAQEIEFNETPVEDLEPDVQQDVRTWLSGDGDTSQIGYHVTMAIHHKLDTVNREVGGVVYAVRDLISKEQDKAWQKSHEADRSLTPRDESKKLWQEAMHWGEIKDDFALASRDLDLVYCSICHEHPVALHHEHYDSRVSDEPICDECFKKVATGALKMTESEWSAVKGGEWRCGFCVNDKGQRPLLYKFAQRNVISTLGKNGVPLKIELEYGRMHVEAKCPNCHTLQSKTGDWGWVD